MRKYVIIAAALGLAAPALAQEENEISMDQVPQAAMEAAQAKAEGIEFTKAQMDDDEGTETYELSGTMENGMAIEVDVLADGTVEEVEEEIEMSEVPQEVTAALEQNLAGFQPSFIEKSTRDDGATVVYEFEGQHDGKEIDAEINADGSNFTMNEDTAG